jgi:AMMECR1 domain-containing protein
LEEFPKLSVCVSLLVNFKKDQDLFGWEIGRHGIIINLKRNGKDYQATYLPEVAKEWEWTHEETLKSLLQKSGCRLPLSSVQS